MSLGCNQMRQHHPADGCWELPLKQNEKHLVNFDFTLLSNNAIYLNCKNKLCNPPYSNLFFWKLFFLKGVMRGQNGILSLTVKNMHRHATTLCV
jgi:hypothetical protein